MAENSSQFLLQIPNMRFLSMGRYFLFTFVLASLLVINSVVSAKSWCPLPPNRSLNTEFKQRINRFWEFEEKSRRWVEMSLPYDLMSCTNGSCSKVGSIENWEKKNQEKNDKIIDYDRKEIEERMIDQVLPVRKRFSITKMSEASIWVTGLSGSVYERLWNGMRWVIAPHELPTSAGAAVSVFIINQTILALSEAGMLYQLQLNENSQPIWSEFVLKFEQSVDATEEEEPSPVVRIKTGAVSHDGERLFLTTMDGSLLEIIEFQPSRWENHGRPPGGDVSSLADIGILKTSVVFSISSTGDLYEFDKKTKPSWKKHIWSEASVEAVPLAASIGCTLHGLVGARSLSLFLLTKDGFLIERRLHKRKWKWMIHGAPKGHQLSAITLIQQHYISEKLLSIFFTTSDGFIFEYQLPKYSGVNREDQIEGLWINHMHPQHAKIARGITGAQLQPGRIIFPLDDGRLAELHLAGMGGEGVSPIPQINIRRKGSYKYEWSILDTPESEGWNAEYCTDERGLLNCIAGMNDALADDETEELGMTAPGRMQAPTNQHYLSLPNRESTSNVEQNNFLTKSIKTNFRMRVMHADRSFFLVSDSGQTFEYLYTENIWLWLRHEHPTAMNGALGSYNGSLFLVDVYGSLLIRERIGNDLSWINCTSLKKGKQVATGPPWDGVPGRTRRASAEDALFFVNKRGRLLQFMVAQRKFKWKDCRSPTNTRIAFIVDQEVFRMNIIFVVGRNGRLYQYNKVTELWHEHNQSPHLVLSRSPGTAMRPSLTSLSGSIFMISENGGLVEYHWSSTYGWEWVEHGTPDRGVKLVGAPGPCLSDTELFIIGSNGCVYGRHLDEKTWKWTNYGYPQIKDATLEDKVGSIKEQSCAPVDHQAPNEKNDNADSFRKYCIEKVAAVRPIPFSEDSLVFELQDSRLAELRRSRQATAGWEWIRIIGTPASLCLANYWTAVAS